MHMLKSALAGLLALLTVAPAAAQVNLNNLPTHTVVGRSGTTTGPAQAIPFDTLASQLGTVTGPGSAVIGNLPYWADILGTQLGAASWANLDTTNKRLVLRKDTGTFPVPGSNTGLAIFGPDSPGGESRLDIVANTSDAVITCNRINGTWAAPTVVTAGQQICGWTGGSIDTNGSTTFQQGGYIGSFALNTWSTSDHSWYWDIGTIPGSSTTLARTARFSAPGGFHVGTADVQPAAGIINAQAGYTVNSAAATSGNVLRGDGTKFVSSALSAADLTAGTTGTININGTVGATTPNTGAFTSLAYSTTLTGTTQSANAVNIGRQGATNPAFQVDTASATGVTGLKVQALAAGSGVGLTTLSSGTNEPMFIDSRGNSALNLNVAASTGAVNYSNSMAGTSTSANALAVGRQGTTNPVLQVDASTASVATGLKIKGAAAAAGLALSVITSGTNENLTIDAAGSGTITLGGTSTGAIALSRALTYGGVTLNNAVTGTGNMVLSTSPALTTPTGIVATDISHIGLTNYKITGVNFNSANTDNAITLTAPPGTYSRYQLFRVYITHCSASATTATVGLFTSTGGGGTAIVASGTAVTVSTASENTANNTQSLTVAVAASGATTNINTSPLQFRVQTPQGSAVTCDVTLQIQWIS